MRACYESVEALRLLDMSTVSCQLNHAGNAAVDNGRQKKKKKKAQEKKGQSKYATASRAVACVACLSLNDC